MSVHGWELNWGYLIYLTLLPTLVLGAVLYQYEAKEQSRPQACERDCGTFQLREELVLCWY